MNFIADFETTSVRVYKEIKHRKEGKVIVEKKLDTTQSKAFVCAWAIIPQEINPNPKHIARGRTIESFITYIENLALEIKKQNKKRNKINIYTHNLKFDSDFILYYILKNNVAELTSETREAVLYNFAIKFPSGAEVRFYDSLKIFPMPAEALGQLYGIPKLKGEWDYKKYRDETTEITAQEWEYLDHDVMIVSKALADYRARGYIENTQAAIAYNERLRMTYPKFNKTYAKRLKKKSLIAYRNAFPADITPLPFYLHKHLLLGYFGGVSWLNPKYACVDIINGASFDVHSMYPFQMSEPPLPIGLPFIIENPTPEEADRILNQYSCVMADFENLTICLKSPRHFPFLMFQTDPDTSIRCQGKVICCKNEIAVLSNYDYKILKTEYNIYSMKITRLYCFKSKRQQYKAFVDFWMGQKTEADKIKNDPSSTPEQVQNALVQRSIAKVMMNASYGKDGTKLLRQANKTVYNPELDVLENELNAEITEPEYYLPSAIFICALARYQLYSAVILVRDDFIYSDTDSVKVTKEGREILEKSPDFEIDDYKLGSWGFEGVYETARFVRQKTYTYTQNGERHFTVCGAPDSIKSQMRIDDFLPGMEITLDDLHESGQEGKLIPVRVPGGVILEETGFHISFFDNWDERNGRNMPIDYNLFCDTIERKNKEFKDYGLSCKC